MNYLVNPEPPVWDVENSSSNVALTESGQRATANGSDTTWYSLAAEAGTAGPKWYAEVEVVTGGHIGGSDSTVNIGVTAIPADASLTSGGAFLGSVDDTWGYIATGDTRHDSTNTATGTLFDAGDIVMIAVDETAGLIWWGVNGTWVSGGDPAAGTGAQYSGLPDVMRVACSLRERSGEDGSVRIHTSSATQEYSAPDGFMPYGDFPATHRVPGATYVDGVAVSRTVRATRYSDGEPLGEAVSDAGDGTFEIALSAGDAVMVLAFDDYGAQHATETAYSVGDNVFPATPNEHWYQVESGGGGTSGASPPTWPTNGGTVTDGTVTWRDMGTMRQPEARGPFIPVPVEA